MLDRLIWRPVSYYNVCFISTFLLFSIAFSDCIGYIGLVFGYNGTRSLVHVFFSFRFLKVDKLVSFFLFLLNKWACLVPGAPPMNVTAVAISPTAIRVSWQPPPAERAHGRIAYYKLLCVESGRGDSEATVVKLNHTSFVLDELRRWTEYRIWVLAGTSVGDGPSSYPVTVRTHEDGMCPFTNWKHSLILLNFPSAPFYDNFNII